MTDFNDHLVEECAKEMYDASPLIFHSHGGAAMSWAEVLADAPEDAVCESTVRRFHTYARACLSRAYELTFSKIKSDIEPGLTDRALKAAAAEWWRPKP